MRSTARSRRSSAPMTSPAARARSTSTCCGRWAARSASSTASSSAPRAWSRGVTCGAGMPYKLSRDRRLLRRQLSADHQLGAGVQRAVEARLSQGRRMARRGGLRGPVAGRRPQRPVERRGPAQAAGPLSARRGAARDDARAGHRRQRSDRHGRRRLAARRMGPLDRQSRARARSSSSSERGRC